MVGIRIKDLSNPKLALLLGTDLFSIVGDKFHKIATHNKSGAWYITVGVGLKGSGEQFRTPLVI